MADTKTTALTEITAPVSTDLVYVVGDPGTTPVSRKATLATIRKTLMVDGWIESGETWTYASADAPTFTFTISGDLTGKYSPGMRIKLTQTTVKYFIITAVSYGAPNTTVTVYGGTDYTLANAAISANYYSMSKAPFGFPLSPAKWAVEVDFNSYVEQTNPTTGTWYNVGSITISAPIGVWNGQYSVATYAGKGTATVARQDVTLSTANNSESNNLTTGEVQSSADFASMITKSFILTLTVKTAHYLNHKGLTNMATIAVNNAANNYIRLVCAYL